VFHQILSLVGASLILLAYAGNQHGWLPSRDRRYAALNLLGSLALLWVAIVDWRLGFMALEGAWALLSIPPLLRGGGPPSPAGASDRASPLG
jgi:hypothetical protein